MTTRSQVRVLLARPGDRKPPVDGSENAGINWELSRLTALESALSELSGDLPSGLVLVDPAFFPISTARDSLQDADTVDRDSNFLKELGGLAHRLRHLERQAATLEALAAPVGLLDSQGILLSTNNAWREFAAAKIGREMGWEVGANYLDTCRAATGHCAEFGARAADGILSVLRDGQSEFVLDYPMATTGKTNWFRLIVTPEEGAEENAGAVVMHLNITAQKLAEMAVADREGRLRAILESEPACVKVVSPRGVLLEMNQAGLRLVEASEPTKVCGRPVVELIHPEDRPAFLELQERVARGESGELEFRILGLLGTTRWVETHSTPLRDEQGRVAAVLSITHDITKRREAEEAVRESERRYRLLFEHNPQPMTVYDRETLRYLAVNEAAVAHYGYSHSEFASMTLVDLVPSEMREALLETVHRVTGRLRKPGVWRQRRKDGSWIDVEIVTYDLEFQGCPARLCLHHDVTERLEAERRMRLSEERFRLVSRATNDAIWDWDIEGNQLWWGEGFEQMSGFRPDEVEVSLDSWVNRIHPEDRARVLDGLHAAVDRGDQVWSAEYRFLRKDGSIAYLYDRGYVLRAPEGRAVRMIGGMRDITEQRSLELQLIQSQKMEAVGRLAGGIAHDFNNLLTIILGYSEVLQSQCTRDDPRAPYLEGILDAGERAANLTRQLLAISRNQVLAPRVLDLSQEVDRVQQLLRRLIGEDIRLATSLAPGISRVRVDPGQLEQVIINLVVNARDAMPDGGLLSISTSEVEYAGARSAEGLETLPGRYVVLTVADTGSGMTPEVMARLYEPFFTTKEPGRGTGLGLPTVFGIVKQSDGFIEVDSNPGEGACFRILFPAVQEAIDEPVRRESERMRGSEAILLVEDDVGVRRVAKMSLERQGYCVLEAESGREALEELRVNPQIALVVSDLVMPEMGGAELARALRKEQPGIAILFMSGYTEDANAPDLGRSAEPFLQKPFTPVSLARKVREVLDSRNAPKL